MSKNTVSETKSIEETPTLRMKKKIENECFGIFTISCELFHQQADIYFSASPPKRSNGSSQGASSSPGPVAPTAAQERTSLYKISTISLMGQFLDPPLSRKVQLDVSAPPNGNHASDDELASTTRRSDSPVKEDDTIHGDVPATEPASRSASRPWERKVSDPVDPRSAVKYSGNLSWTTV